jgi:hypothetical protein
MHSLSRWGLAVVASALLATGCSVTFARPGPTQTTNTAVELNGAERVNVRLRPALYDLTLEGGADGLLEAEFTYNVEELEPTVSYAVENGVGNLLIAPRQQTINTIPVGNVVSTWALQLNEDVPLDLTIELGLGDSELDFSALTLTALNIEAGAGSVRATLGRQELEELEINSGLGNVDLHLGGGRIDRLDLDGGAGKLTLDFTGEWEADLNADINGGLGAIDLTLPNDVGVRITADSGLGNIHADAGLRLENEHYVNAAYGQSAITLEIEIDQGVGDVTLRLAE